MRPNRTLAAAALVVAAALGLAACGAWPGAFGGEDPATSPPPKPAPAAPETSTLPTFDPATAVGRYAPGFPVDLLGAPDGATVLASSARPAEGSLVEVTLNLATTSTARKIVDQLGKPLRKAGFEQSRMDTGSGLSAQTVFTRTTERRKAPLVESLIIGVLDEGERRLVTVSGSVVVKD